VDYGHMEGWTHLFKEKLYTQIKGISKCLRGLPLQ
jgi:hypothetical protein